MTKEEFANGMREHFGIPTSLRYIDKKLYAFGGIVTIDIIEFDNYLHNKFGDYEDEEISMEELIKKEYGKKANDFIIRAIEEM